MPTTSETMQPPCVEWLLSDFCKELDQSALPIFDQGEKIIVPGEDSPTPEESQRNLEWNCLQKQLLSATTNIRDDEQAIQFLKKWLLRSSDPLSHISDVALGERVTPVNNIPIKNIQAVLQERRVCTRNKLLELLRAMDMFLRDKLKGIESPTRTTVQLNPFKPPLTLIRIWGDDSPTIYTELLGFRCGNWKKCQPANDFIEMKNRKLSNLQRISDHCEDKRSLSDWISFSDSASWILSKRLDSFLLTQRNCHIAIIKVASLDKLRIPWQRSDLLVQQLGGNVYSTKKSGVQYAWPGHYLVYGWVPSQCIIKLFTLKEFTDLCNQRNIVKVLLWNFILLMNSSNVNKLEANEPEVALSTDALEGTGNHCSIVQFKIGFLKAGSRNAPSVALKQGGIAEAAIGGVIEIIDSIINCTLFLADKLSPRREIFKGSNTLITT